MSVRFNKGDRVWYEEEGWEIIRTLKPGDNPPASIMPIYMGKSLSTGAEVWFREDEIKRMTEEEVVGEIMRGSDGDK